MNAGNFRENEEHESGMCSAHTKSLLTEVMRTRLRSVAACGGCHVSKSALSLAHAVDVVLTRRLCSRTQVPPHCRHGMQLGRRLCGPYEDRHGSELVRTAGLPTPRMLAGFAAVRDVDVTSELVLG